MSRLAAGTLSAERVTEVALAQIERIDPSLNAIIEINPDALAIARDLDRQPTPLGPLHGVPVVLKANIDTGDAMATSAGSLALAGCSQRMDDQPKIEPYEESAFFSERPGQPGLGMREPIAGTVARGGLRLDTHFFDGRVDGQRATPLPERVELDRALLDRPPPSGPRRPRRPCRVNAEDAKWSVTASRSI